MKSPKKSAAFAENISEFSGGVMYGKFGIDDNVIAFASEVEKGLGERFAEIDKNAECGFLPWP